MTITHLSEKTNERGSVQNCYLVTVRDAGGPDGLAGAEVDVAGLLTGGAGTGFELEDANLVDGAVVVGAVGLVAVPVLTGAAGCFGTAGAETGAAGAEAGREVGSGFAVAVELTVSSSVETGAVTTVAPLGFALLPNLIIFRGTVFVFGGASRPPPELRLITFPGARSFMGASFAGAAAAGCFSSTLVGTVGWPAFLFSCVSFFSDDSGFAK